MCCKGGAGAGACGGGGGAAFGVCGCCGGGGGAFANSAMGIVRIELGGGLGLDSDPRAPGVLEPSAMDVSDPDLKRFALCSCATISSAVIIGAIRAGALDLREAAAIAALIRIAGMVTFGRFAFAGTANVLTSCEFSACRSRGAAVTADLADFFDS